mmetsp:Transcript_34869/g.85298  ORF Transcript_34869/g.85298 Transcript_34869/m.85298 type:complete len:165 (-) Transcript_34869:310-804(-)
MCKRRFMTSTVLRVSRSPVGSSKSKSCGRLASARAIATRCCSPPESSLGRWSMRSRRPTAVSSSVARLDRSSALAGSPQSIMGSATFSNAESADIKLNVWKTKPILRSRRSAICESDSRAPMAVPRMVSVPPEGLSSAPRRLSRVVLPPPDGPRTMTNSRSRIG